MVKFSRQADQRRVLPQQPRAKAVKRAHPHRLARGQPLDRGPHLVGGLVGKRQRQDLTGRHAMAQQVGNAMRDRRGSCRCPGRQESTAGRRDARRLRAAQASTIRAIGSTKARYLNRQTFEYKLTALMNKYTRRRALARVLSVLSREGRKRPPGRYQFLSQLLY